MRTFGPATFHYAEGGNAELRLVEQQEQVGGSFLHVHVHRCSMEICEQVECVHACRVRLFWWGGCRSGKEKRGKIKSAKLTEWMWLRLNAWELVKFLFPLWLGPGERSEGDGRVGGG